MTASLVRSSQPRYGSRRGRAAESGIGSIRLVRDPVLQPRLDAAARARGLHLMTCEEFRCSAASSGAGAGQSMSARRRRRSVGGTISWLSSVGGLSISIRCTGTPNRPRTRLRRVSWTVLRSRSSTAPRLSNVRDDRCRQGSIERRHHHHRHRASIRISCLRPCTRRMVDLRGR